MNTLALAILSARTVKKLALQRNVKQTFLKIKQRKAFWNNKFSNATYDWNMLLTTLLTSLKKYSLKITGNTLYYLKGVSKIF